jgi:uncharacterized protein YcbX
MEVAQLWRWPVEGTDGESMPSVRVDVRGVGGDRTHAILARAGGGWAPVALSGWRSSYPFAIGAALDPAKPPYAVVTAPDGRHFRWGDPRLRTALEDDLGVAVRLQRDPDTPRSVLIATAAAPVAHANLRLDADVVGWRCGAELRFAGGARLRVLAPVPGGGARARVLANGRIAAGEPFELIAS